MTCYILVLLVNMKWRKYMWRNVVVIIIIITIIITIINRVRYLRIM